MWAIKPTPHESCSFAGSYSPRLSGSLIGGFITYVLVLRVLFFLFVYGCWHSASVVLRTDGSIRTIDGIKLFRQSPGH